MIDIAFYNNFPASLQRPVLNSNCAFVKILNDNNMVCFGHCGLPLVCEGIAARVLQNVIVSELDGCEDSLAADMLNAKKMNLAGEHLELGGKVIPMYHEAAKTLSLSSHLPVMPSCIQVLQDNFEGVFDSQIPKVAKLNH